MAPKTLLIYPFIKDAIPTVPIGLAYLAGMLLKFGYPVKIIDTIAENMDDDCLMAEIIAFKPDFIGISAMFSQYEANTLNTAYIARKSAPTAKIVLGGAHASVNAEKILKEAPFVDYVVQGEGERAILDIVDGWARPGIVHLPYIQDLDMLPLPARNLLPMDKYFSFRSPYVLRNPAATLISSRGCPKHCIYCNIHSVWGDEWRKRTAKSVVDEIELLKNTYGVKEVQFSDDNVSADPKRMNEICDELIKRDLGIKWCTPTGIALWTLNKDLIKKMKRAGCYRLTFGIESGSAKMQKYIRKNLNFDLAKQVIKWANDEGLWTVCTHIIGFPGETEEDVNDTINFAIQSKPDFALFYNLSIFKGAVVDTMPEPILLSVHDVERLQALAYRRFMLSKIWHNPFMIFKKIYSWEMLAYAIRLGVSYLSIGSNLIKFKRMGTNLMYSLRKNKCPTAQS